MKMVNVKLPKMNKEQETKSQPSIERERWPYGLKLTFEAEQVDKLPQLEKMKIGQNVNVEGIGEITSIRMSEEKEGKKRYSVEVQLHEVGCESNTKMAHESMGDAIERSRENHRT